MSKRLGVVLMALGAVLAAVYAVVAVCTFKTTEKEVFVAGTPAPEHAPIEISYNYVTYTSGAIEYTVQASFDEEVLNPEGDAERAAAIKKSVSDIRAAFEERGYSVGAGSGDYFVTATILSASGLTELDIMLGNDGYMTGSSSIKPERSFWQTVYTVPLSFPFDGAEDSVLTIVTAIARTTPGVATEDIDLVYNYGSYYSTKSVQSNADYVYYLNYGNYGSYIHEFRVNLSEEPKEYYLVQYNPNATSAYIVLIAFALVAGGAVIFFLGSRKQH